MAGMNVQVQGATIKHESQLDQIFDSNGELHHPEAKLGSRFNDKAGEHS